MRLPIRTRLTAAYALFLAVILAGLGAFLVLKLRSDLRSTIDREVTSSAAAIKPSYLREGVSGFEETSRAALRREGAAAQVIDARGRVIASFGGDLAEDAMLEGHSLARAFAGTMTIDAEVGDSEQPFRLLAVPVTVHGQRQLLVVGESLQSVNEAVRKILLLLLIAVPIALAAACFAGWWIVRNALLPVDRMRRKAEQIGIDQLHERVSAPNPADEIGQLAATLNAMLDRLESGVGARRRLVADASHELRTPLAAMRAELDVSLRDPERTEAERATLQSVREDVDRMSRTVDNLLTLALADEGRLELRREPLELDQLARSAARSMTALAASQGVLIRADGEPCPAVADATRLSQALTNLIENAIKFSPPGSQVTVSSWRRGNEAGVTVADTGPGIPADAASHVFDRFYRGDPSRSRESGGSGLGLSICYEIMAAHRGRIWVESSEGSGSAFSIALPVLGSPPLPAEPARPSEPAHT
jgi:two-component system OmpR family sensor kinase